MTSEKNTTVGMICYLRPLDKNELAMANKYWEVYSTCVSLFTMTVTELSSLYPGYGSPSSFVPTISEFVIRDKELACSKCHSMPRVNNRMGYLAALKELNSVCAKCKNEAIELEQKRNIDILDAYKAKLFERHYSLTDLTYIEKIYLFLILNSYYNGDGPLSITNENLDLSGSQDSDSKLFVDLAQKGCLVIVDDLPEEVQEAYAAIYGRYSRLHYDNGYNRSSYSETRSLAQGIYFNMPKQIEDNSQVRSELYSHICASKISTAEIQQITQLVEDIRLANLYECIDWLEQEEYRIPIEKSMKLDSLLKFVSKSYSLDKTYYSLWYHARETGAYIQKIGSRDFKTPKYFGKFLSDYFTKVKAKGWELKHPRNLPMNVNTSAIESLICELYFDDEFNWVSLTTAEIVSTWLKKLNVTDTPLIEDSKD